MPERATYPVFVWHHGEGCWTLVIEQCPVGRTWDHMVPSVTGLRGEAYGEVRFKGYKGMGSLARWRVLARWREPVSGVSWEGAASTTRAAKAIVLGIALWTFGQRAEPPGMAKPVNLNEIRRRIAAATQRGG